PRRPLPATQCRGKGAPGRSIPSLDSPATLVGARAGWRHGARRLRADPGIGKSLALNCSFRSCYISCNREPNKPVAKSALRFCALTTRKTLLLGQRFTNG